MKEPELIECCVCKQIKPRKESKHSPDWLSGSGEYICFECNKNLEK